MANISAAAPVAPGEFRIGRVLSRAMSVLSRNFLPFFVVTLIATLPLVPLTAHNARTVQGNLGGSRWAWTTSTPEGVAPSLALLLFLLWLVLYVVAQVVVLYGAFQVMRGRPVNLIDGLRVGLARFFPIIGVGVCIFLSFAAVTILTGLVAWIARSTITFIIAPFFFFGLCFTLLTMWFAAIPACVVERLGPLASMGRSSALTKGHRWKIFGMILLVLAVAMIVGMVVAAILILTGSSVLGALANLAWNALVTAFYAVFVVVTYHDLRVAKEGVDVHQIAAVFD